MKVVIFLIDGEGADELAKDSFDVWHEDDAMVKKYFKYLDEFKEDIFARIEELGL